MKAGILLLSLATLAAACSDERSMVVVSVLSSGGPIARVAQLRVQATNGQTGEYHQDLFYPKEPRSEDALLELNQDSAKAVTFSLSFRPLFKGTVTFEVEALDPAKNVLASGKSSPEQLTVGQVTYATVKVSPACDPMQPAATCGNGQNCAFVCDSSKQAKTVCMSSGLTKPGEVCGDLANCVPGSECFEFTCLGTSIKTCRQFCASDADCGPGATCSMSISCSASSNQARICSRPCDPTGNATGGCVAGLRCFVYSGEVTDCACSPSTRTGTIGQVCSNDDGCMPGLTCVDRGGQKSCRPLCVLTATGGCPSGTTCTALSSPVYKVYGACL